jgi:threonylcarbamoyladenosine tRNA methylthiotransferase CDKAL1
MKKVFIKTYGCSFNQADSENMAGLLEDSGRYKTVDNEEEADLVVINSCTVKNKSETKFWKDVRQINKTKILAGCVPQASVNRSSFEKFTVVGTSQIDSIVEAADGALSGTRKHFMKKEHTPRLNIPKLRKNSVIEILPINEGCLGSCNFCKTKFARGHLHSYPPEDIVRQAREALNQGVQEIWLTSQDTACYGYDINTNIVQLLKMLLEMKRDYKIRLGMGNPDFLPDYIDELIDVFRDERMFRFIHIPVQAGSDSVLKAMKRNYTVSSFRKIVKKIQQEIPDMTIATDIICGYPDEKDDDFKETVSLIEEIRPDVINVSRFWPRPGTVAAKKKLLPTDVVKMRSSYMSNLHYRISEENNRKWLDWQGQVIVSELGKDNTVVARNYAYKPIILQEKLELGTQPMVKITRTTIHDLRGVKQTI